jgi:hypothetical protein
LHGDSREDLEKEVLMWRIRFLVDLLCFADSFYELKRVKVMEMTHLNKKNFFNFNKEFQKAMAPASATVKGMKIHSLS